MAIVRRCVEEIWVKGDPDVLEELFSPDFVFHSPVAGRTFDKEGYKLDVLNQLTSCADIEATVEDIIASGDTPPQLRLHILYSDVPRKTENTLRGLENGTYVDIYAVYQRTA